MPKIFKFNPFDENSKPKYTIDLSEEELHGIIERTSYSTVSYLVKTAGCTTTKPHYNWHVLGLIQTARGPLLVAPNEWVVEVVPGQYIILTDEEFKNSQWDNQ